MEKVCALNDAFGICKFSSAETFAVEIEDFAEGYKLLTGIPLSKNKLLEAGERIVNLERAINIREGLSRKQDMLPQRFLKEPLKVKGYPNSVIELNPMLDEYYKLRGWNIRTGKPTSKTLQRLGLADVAEVVATK